MKRSSVAIRFIPTLFAFPIGGELVSLAIGSIRTPTQALAGGIIVGLLVGVSQFIALRKFGASSSWIWSSMFSLAISNYGFAMAFGLKTDSIHLMIQGAFTGLFIGLAQAFSQRITFGKVIYWALANSATWSLAWLVTSKVIVDIEFGYAIFGSSGALIATSILTFVIPNIFRGIEVGDK
jgi:hypothetical protein